MSVDMYLENPYLKELKGRIIKKEKVGENYHITLDRTIFYPRHSETTNIDSGTINGVKVIDVFKEKYEIIHVLEKNIGSKDVKMKIDWKIRFDYMQQHTGAHILSAAVNKLFGVDTMGVCFDLEYSYIKTGLNRLTSLDTERIEKLANNIVYSNFKIKRKNPEMVSIENINIVHCEGIHCSSTGEIGLIKIVELKKNKDKNIDIAFVCGSRALINYSKVLELTNDISQMLSVEKSEIYEELEYLLSQNKALKEKVESLEKTKNQNEV